MLTTATLDDMVAAHETPFSLLNWEFLTNAKVVTLLALYSWLSPLVVILTTNTLLLQPAEEIQEAMCPGVPTLNFSFEADFHGGDGMKIFGVQQVSLNLWDTKSENSSEFPSDYIYTWNGRSDLSTQYFEMAMKLNRSLTYFDDNFIVCERGWNCTIEVQFEGPAYKCQQIARGVGAKVGGLRQESGEVESPISFEMLAPTGNYSWIGHPGLGDYALPQMNPNWTRDRERDTPIPKNMGAFRTEPVVWIGYSEYINSTIPPDTERSGTEYNPDAWEPVLIACEHYEAVYTAELRYIDGSQVHRIKSRKLIAPIINTTFVGYTETDDGTWDDTTAFPESNYVLPSDVKRYGKIAAYHSFGAFIRSTINGTIHNRFTARTPVENTNLIDSGGMLVHPGLMERFQTHYEMFLLSLLGNPNYVGLSWAANPKSAPVPGEIIPPKSSEYRCARSRPGVKYYYRTRILVIVYSVAALLAILGVAAGTIALRKNGGVPRNTRFSSILAATRAKSLNQVNWDGPERDNGNISSDLKRQKLGYGKLRSSEGDGVHGDGSHESKTAEAQYGFGFEGEVDQTPAMRSRRAFFTNAADG
ncbi:hypothetical protein CGLO_05454 [Colletotrichum gloeosporioides Cg-14]|uniref:Uncharacterized protein n=1 Tax=Colletotrichum gloeosporioides (strain Cg-14) TaxID=1237896 RepID=T0KGW6_COLGC|nr:hypothetical protein CGLO_05454 [Colletotrichum gloeosporioides Cg-14]